MKLARLLYASRLNPETDPNQLARIHETANTRNAKHNVSGILIFGNDQFLQLLEGAPTDINKLYLNISRDPRNFDHLLLDYSEISERQFEAWAMKLVLITPKQQAQLKQFQPQEDFEPLKMNAENALKFCSFLRARNSLAD